VIISEQRDVDAVNSVMSMTAIMTTMLHACALDLAKTVTSSSACADSVEEFLPLEGAVGAVQTFFGYPARNGKIPEPDKRKRKRVHYKICHRVFSYIHNTTNSAYCMVERILSQQQPLCGSLVVATFSPASLQTTLYTR